ncbi:MAG: hypothetical protein Q9227_005030 [Pyrenula ochraceoflavens]
MTMTSQYCPYILRLERDPYQNVGLLSRSPLSLTDSFYDFPFATYSEEYRLASVLITISDGCGKALINPETEKGDALKTMEWVACGRTPPQVTTYSPVEAMSSNPAPRRDADETSNNGDYAVQGVGSHFQEDLSQAQATIDDADLRETSEDQNNGTVHSNANGNAQSGALGSFTGGEGGQPDSQNNQGFRSEVNGDTCPHSQDSHDENGRSNGST